MKFYTDSVTIIIRFCDLKVILFKQYTLSIFNFGLKVIYMRRHNMNKKKTFARCCPKLFSRDIQIRKKS